MCAASAVLLLLAFTYLPSGFVDDSYILFRYAGNLAHGHGIVWNPGEPPVEGFTSLSWVLLLAGLSGITGAAIPDVARAAGVALGIGSLLCYWLVARRCLGRSGWTIAALVPVHLAISPIVARHAISGLETSLVVFLTGVLALVWTRHATSGEASHQPVSLAVSSIVTFLLVLTRPDALVYAGAGALALALSTTSPRAGARHYVVYFALPLMALLTVYAAWKLWYFGSLVPLPAFMKLAPHRIYQSPVLFRYVYSQWFGFLAYAAPVVVAALWGIGRAAPRNAAVAALAAGSAAHALYLLTVVPVMGIHWRFFYPVLAPLVVLGAVGLDQLRRASFESVQTSRAGFATAALSAFFCLYNVGHWGPTRDQIVRDGTSLPSLIDLGRALAEAGPIRIAYSEVGAIAFYSGASVLDLSGLNDPVIARHRFTAAGRMPAILEDHLLGQPSLPDVYIRPPAEYGFAQLEHLPRIRPAYTLVAEAGPGSGPLHDIFVRRDSPYYGAIVDRLRAGYPDGRDAASPPPSS